MTTASPQVGDRMEPGSTPGADRLELRVLGPLEARVDGSPVRLGGRKQRTALALLASFSRVDKKSNGHRRGFIQQAVLSAAGGLRPTILNTWLR